MLEEGVGQKEDQREKSKEQSHRIMSIQRKKMREKNQL